MVEARRGKEVIHYLYRASYLEVVVLQPWVVSSYQVEILEVVHQGLPSSQEVASS